MTLIELFGCLGAVAGLILGAIFGNDFYGPIGAVVGGLCGAFLGCAISLALLVVAGGVGILFERHQQRRRLKHHFGRYYSRRSKQEWESTKDEFNIGQSVAGTMVAEFYHGVFVDLGCGFPALLSRTQFATGTEVSIHSQVEAHVFRFSDFQRCIEISQGDVKETLRIAKALKKARRKSKSGSKKSV